MKPFDPDEEVDHILSILSRNSGPQLREIHEKLTEIDESSFTHLPPRGEGYNDERYLLKGLIEFLSVKEELISADGTQWSLTKDGRREVL